MNRFVKVLIAALTVEWTMCYANSIYYFNALTNQQPQQPTYPRGEDPCNPLYWYPRHIPVECERKDTPKPVVPPIPIPIPLPHALPPLPVVPVPLPPIPYGIPIVPTHPMIPVAGLPYPYVPLPPPPSPASFPYPGSPPGPPPQPPIGIGPFGQMGPVGPIASGPMLPMVPFAPMGPLLPMRQVRPMGPVVQNVVGPGGGVNIMPMSSAYSELLKKNRKIQKRKEMEKLVKKYDPKWWSKKYDVF